jgi:hypothetical protein
MRLELDEVVFVSSVKCGGEMTGRVVTKGHSGETWAASFENGLVSLRNKKAVAGHSPDCLVPAVNVLYMVVTPPPPPEEKASKK